MDLIYAPNVAFACQLTLVAIFLYHFVVYPNFLSPLVQIPNAHPLAPFTSTWMLWVRYRNKENETILKAHYRHGKIVRLGPREVSVNCVDNGIKTIFGKGFEKTHFYSVFENYGVPNMFSSLQSAPHAMRKRRISNIYSKTFLQSSPDFERIIWEITSQRLLPLFSKAARMKNVENVFPIYKSTAMDITTSYFFGLSAGTSFLIDEEARAHWQGLYSEDQRPASLFFLQELPRLTSRLAQIGINLVPEKRHLAHAQVAAWCLQMSDGAERVLNETQAGQQPKLGHRPIVYEQLKRGLKKGGVSQEASISQSLAPKVKQGLDEKARGVLQRKRSLRQLEVSSELLDQLIATNGTIGTTLLYVTWQLSQNPTVLTQLQKEFRSLSTTFSYSSLVGGCIPSAKEVDELPYLHAVLMETLRLHPPVAGSQPRLTPTNDKIVLGTNMEIPERTRVSSSAWSLHRNPDVFPNPEEWQPQRWLHDGIPSKPGENADKKERWFWAFSSGSRMCIGSNFAIHIMKFVIVAIYTNFKTHIIDDEGIEQDDGFISGPKGDKLTVQFEAI